MKEMQLAVGVYHPDTVEITNKQNCVEYKPIKGFVTEEEARRAAGNLWKDTYAYSYDGYYFNRKQALQRLEKELETTLQEVLDLKEKLNEN